MGGRDSKPDFHINLNGKCVLNPKNGITDFDRSPHILMGSEFHETAFECGHVAPTNSTRWPSLEVTAKVELILKIRQTWIHMVNLQHKMGSG